MVVWFRIRLSEYVVGHSEEKRFLHWVQNHACLSILKLFWRLYLYYTLQEKSVPRHIRKAFYDAHSEMDHTTSKLQAAAQDLKKCLENVLHEDDLNKRASSMTNAHYQSLKQIFAGAIGHKDSAMLHWLQLSMNLGNPGQGNDQL